MSRPSTGAWTVYQSFRIELSYLLKHGFIKRGHVTPFNLTWENRQGGTVASASLVSSLLGYEQGNYLEVRYKVKTSEGRWANCHYKVMLLEVASNLGRGKVLYFQCPYSGERCRILYKAYDSPAFLCRNAYQNRVYYDCQRSSKLMRYSNSGSRAEGHLQQIKLRAKRGKRKYKGKLTKAAQRYNQLLQKKRLMEDLSWDHWYHGLSKLVYKGLHLSPTL